MRSQPEETNRSGEPVVNARHNLKAPKRRLEPAHIIILVVCLAAIGLLARGWLNSKQIDQGAPTNGAQPTTTRTQAEARSQGQAREGSNSSQDAYTAQNQSREPEHR
jgi:hypothetical protein